MPRKSKDKVNYLKQTNNQTGDTTRNKKGDLRHYLLERASA